MSEPDDQPALTLKVTLTAYLPSFCTAEDLQDSCLEDLVEEVIAYEGLSSFVGDLEDWRLEQYRLLPPTEQL